MGNGHSRRTLAAANVRTSLLGHQRVVDPVEEYAVDSFYYLRQPSPSGESASTLRTNLANCWADTREILQAILNCNTLLLVAALCVVIMVSWLNWDQAGPRHPMARNVSMLHVKRSRLE